MYTELESVCRVLSGCVAMYCVDVRACPCESWHITGFIAAVSSAPPNSPCLLLLHPCFAASPFLPSTFTLPLSSLHVAFPLIPTPSSSPFFLLLFSSPPFYCCCFLFFLLPLCFVTFPRSCHCFTLWHLRALSCVPALVATSSSSFLRLLSLSHLSYPHFSSLPCFVRWLPPSSLPLHLGGVTLLGGRREKERERGKRERERVCMCVLSLLSVSAVGRWRMEPHLSSSCALPATGWKALSAFSPPAVPLRLSWPRFVTDQATKRSWGWREKGDGKTWSLLEKDQRALRSSPPPLFSFSFLFFFHLLSTLACFGCEACISAVQQLTRVRQESGGLSSGTRLADCDRVKNRQEGRRRRRAKTNKSKGETKSTVAREKARQKRLRITKRGLSRGKKGVEFCGGEEIRAEGSWQWATSTERCITRATRGEPKPSHMRQVSPFRLFFVAPSDQIPMPPTSCPCSRLKTNNFTKANPFFCGGLTLSFPPSTYKCFIWVPCCNVGYIRIWWLV